MWESLGNSRRQDRVLHGAAKLFNVLIGIVAIPAWLFVQKVTGPIRRLLVDRSRRQVLDLAVPETRERSMDALWKDLQAIPSKLHHVRSAELRKGLADLTPFIFSQHREIANIGYAYPAQFTDSVFEGADGVPIAGTVATHEAGGRPGLIVVHGLFSSRRFDYVREVAVTAFYEWGFNVAAIDLRSFGLTELMTPAPSTAGWKEGSDIVAVARALKNQGSTTVGAWGISLGGSAVLNASFADGAAEALDGGIIAVSAPADPQVVGARLSRTVPFTHPAYLLNRAFRAMLTSRIRGNRWPSQIEKLTDVIDHHSAPYYELSADEIWERAAAKNGIAGAQVPLLILHPEDDMIIKVEEAEKLARAAAGNDNVRVWTLPGGMHGGLDAVDRDWTYAVYRTFFERWADYGRPKPSELVYSAGDSGDMKPVG
jgi:predicted alpha/beta-fold hydrolase